MLRRKNIKLKARFCGKIYPTKTSQDRKFENIRADSHCRDSQISIGIRLGILRSVSKGVFTPKFTSKGRYGQGRSKRVLLDKNKEYFSWLWAHHDLPIVKIRLYTIKQKLKTKLCIAGNNGLFCLHRVQVKVYFPFACDEVYVRLEVYTY